MTPPAALAYLRDGVLRHQEPALQVDCQDAVPQLLGRLLDVQVGVRRLDPDVIEQHVDAAELRDGLLDDALAVGRPAHVGADEEAPVRRHLGDGPLAEFFPDTDPPLGYTLFWRIFSGEPRAVDGYITLDERPGLGLSLNAPFVAQHRADR